MALACRWPHHLALLAMDKMVAIREGLIRAGEIDHLADLVAARQRLRR